MPLGNPDTDPRDRPAILIATRDDLIDVAAAQFGARFPPWWVSSVPRAAVEQVSRLVSAGKAIDELLSALETDLGLGVPLAMYAQEEVRHFSFGVGHTPKRGTIYVQHPLLPDCYIAPEDFARTLAREREAAFRQLASALGAKELSLVSGEVHTKKGLFGVKVSASEAAFDAGIKGSFDEEGKFVKSVYSRFGPPRSPPRVPDDLVKWLKMDPDLRTMARDRIEGHLLEHKISLEFKEGLGVGGEIAAKVAGRGITAGGSYQAMSHSVWRFDVEYWPLDRAQE